LPIAPPVEPAWASPSVHDDINANRLAAAIIASELDDQIESGLRITGFFTFASQGGHACTNGLPVPANSD
jgi:hypothetical protein